MKMTWLDLLSKLDHSYCIWQYSHANVYILFLEVPHICLNTKQIIKCQDDLPTPSTSHPSQFFRFPASHRAIWAADAPRNRENVDRYFKFYWASGPDYSTESSWSGNHHNTTTGDHWEALQNSAGAASFHIKTWGPRREKKDGMLI